jgi:alkylglycerol monooxygenase
MLNPVIIAMPFFVLLTAIEVVYDNYQKTGEYSDQKDTWTNILVGFISVFFAAAFGLAFGYVYQFCYELAPFKFPVEAWWAWVLLFILDDFLYYWFHRYSHESRFFWNFHVVHHSSEQYNLSVAVRQSWFGNSVAWIFFLPLAFLGFPLAMRITVHGFNLIYQFWIHTKFVKRLGILEYVLNAPAHHRVHHGTNEKYLDKNYAGVFIVWDRLFGTFIDETEEPIYGVIKPIKSYNWLWINTHSWVEMFDAMKQRKTLFGKLRCIFASPNMEFTEKI